MNDKIRRDLEVIRNHNADVNVRLDRLAQIVEQLARKVNELACLLNEEPL